MLIPVILQNTRRLVLREMLVPIYGFFYQLYVAARAHHRQKRSEYLLTQLDDYLLDDIGLRREGDDIVPVKKVVCQNNELGRQRRKRRLRHAYLFRRRRLHSGR